MGDGGSERDERPAVLLRNRDFLKLWGGQSVSEMGSQITTLALPLTAVITLHATTFQVGALEAALMAPFLLVGLPAGAIVDRLRMRMVLVVSDVARLFVLGSIPLVAALGLLTLVQLYVVAFVAGVLTVFFDVAYQSYLPALVERDQLAEGNAKLTSTSQIAGVAGPAAGGALVSAVGAATAIAVDAGSYVVSVLSLVGIRHPDVRPARRTGPVLRGLRDDVREGLRFVLRHPMLRMIAGCTGSSNFVTSAAGAVLTVFMVRQLHLSPARIGLIFAVASVAGLLGALIATRVIRWIGVGPTTVAGATIAATGGLLAPLAQPGPRSWLVAAGGGILWFGAVTYNIAQVSLRQAITPPRLLGRMNATMRFMVWGTMPIGALVGGALGTTIGIRSTLWTAAAAGFVSPLFVVFSPVRRLQQIPDVEPEPELVPSPAGPLPTSG